MSVSVTLAPLVRKGPPEGVLDRTVERCWPHASVGVTATWMILYPGEGGGVGVDPLVFSSSPAPLSPSLPAGKGACSSGKNPEQKHPPTDFNTHIPPHTRGVLTGGCAGAARGSRPLPGFPAPIIYLGRRRRTEAIGQRAREHAHFGPPPALLPPPPRQPLLPAWEAGEI